VRIMVKIVRNAGYVLLAAGCIIILATTAGVVMLDGIGKLEEITLSPHAVWNYVAVAPGIAAISLSWLIARHPR